jgi:hypothetical protein
MSPEGAKRFDWPTVAEAIMDVYDFIAQGGEKVTLASEGRALNRNWNRFIRGRGE